jgi:hypothetical protein
MMGNHGGRPKKAKKAKTPGDSSGCGVLFGGFCLVVIGILIFLLNTKFHFMGH